MNGRGYYGPTRVLHKTVTDAMIGDGHGNLWRVKQEEVLRGWWKSPASAGFDLDEIMEIEDRFPYLQRIVREDCSEGVMTVPVIIANPDWREGADVPRELRADVHLKMYIMPGYQGWTGADGRRVYADILTVGFHRWDRVAVWVICSTYSGIATMDGEYERYPDFWTVDPSLFNIHF